MLDIKFPSNIIYDLHSPADVLVDSVLKFTPKSNQITKMVLPHISRETVAGVRSILLHCPSLTTLELKRTRLGYDGILYICSALRNNMTLRHLVIHEDLQLPPFRKKRNFSSFSSMERVPVPDKTTCTDFLLELNDILKDNTTLEKMNIQSGLFLPLSAAGDREYCQWTGLGPLQQFTVGAVRSRMSPNLRRSFSSSDLTQSQTRLFWDRDFGGPQKAPVFDFKKLISKRKVKGKKLLSLPSSTAPDTAVLQAFSALDHRRIAEVLERLFRECPSPKAPVVDFKKLFSKRKERGKKLLSLPSSTAPDTAVLQSFSGLDPRLKECLEISHPHQYVERLRMTYIGMFTWFQSL